MCDDIIEKPSCKILYRQSSIETRLSPVHVSEVDDSDEEICDTTPQIVDYKRKISVEDNNKPSSGNVSKPDNKIVKKLGANLENTIISSLEKSKTGRGGKTSPKQSESNRPKVPPKNTKHAQNLQDDQSGNQKQLEPKTENRIHHSAPTNLLLKETLKNELNRKLEKDGKSSHISNKKEEETVSKNVFIDKPVIKNKDGKSSQIHKRQNALESADETVDLEEELENLRILQPQANEEEQQSVGVLKAWKVTKNESSKEEGGTVGATYKKEEMATVRPKSPRPVVAVRGEKDESIWDKIGTLGRKKRIKEVQEVQAEGKYAIDSPGFATAAVLPPEDYNLDDNEERCMIDPRAYDDPKFIELLNVLKEWINDELASQRIIVQDISEDLYDGQVLQKLLEKLTGDKLDVPEVTQSEEGQKQKLTVVLDHFNQILGIQRVDNKWNVEAIHSKNIVSITHLLVALARHFRPPVRLPEHVAVDVVVVQKVRGQLAHKTVKESLTKAYDDVGMRCERDAFDTLFDHAPDKLQVVKKSLVTFVNKHLNKMNFEVTEIESQFHDGVYLIMLMGLLEGFFVPHYSFNLTPHEFEQKVHNVNFAFELMEEVGLQKPKARPEDVVNMDLKSTLRVLYILFLKYRTVL